jgi:hypothetical protein
LPTARSRVQYLQRLMQDLGLNVAGIRRMLALLPCWDLRPCSADTYKSCPAYRETTRPCWMIEGRACFPPESECRRCVVYRFGSMCVHEIKQLLHDQDDLQDASVAIKELLQRKGHTKKEER